MINKLYRKICLYLFWKYNCIIAGRSELCLFILGCMILTIGISMSAMAAAGELDGEGSGTAEGIIKKQLCKIMQLLQGPFGALVTIVAGLAAVVTAAMGGYKLVPENNMPSLRCAPFRLLLL